MTSKTAKIAALTGGACVFVGGLIGFPFHPMGDLAIALPLSLATAGGLWRFWPGNEPSAKETYERMNRLSDQLDNITSSSGVSQKEVIEAITKGTEKLDKILREAINIKSPNTIRQIKHLDAMGRKIIEDFRLDPGDVRRAQSWLGTGLDQLYDCVKDYARLSTNSARNLDAQRQMTQFDIFLGELMVATQTLLDRLIEDDSTAFQVNMEVFRSDIKNGGFQ